MSANDDFRGDDLLAALRDLPPRDVEPRRARRLGARCRAALASGPRAAPAAPAFPACWPRAAAIALLAAWCAIYVTEVVRRGAVAWQIIW